MINVRSSFANKLSLSILLLAIPILVLSLGILFLQSRYLIRQEVVTRSNNTLQTIMQHIRNHMSTIETAVNSNAWQMENNFTPETLEYTCHRIVDLNRNVLSCSACTLPDYFPQKGRLFSVYTVNYDDSVVTYRESDYEYSDKVWYRTPMRTGKACWVDPFIDNQNASVDYNEAVASYCRPIYHRGERSEVGGQKSDIIGVVSADVSFSKLAQTINAVPSPYPHTYFMLLAGDGRYLIHPDTTLLFRKTIFTDTDASQHADIIALGHEMTAGKQGAMHVRYNDTLYHVCYCPVPGTTWSLALVSPDRDMLTSYSRLGYIIVPIIIIGLILCVWLTLRVVRENIIPIRKLVASSQQIAMGKYDEKIPVSDRMDAVGKLQNSFIKMQQSLMEHMGSIRSTAHEISLRNEGLEQSMEYTVDFARKKTLFIQHVLHQIRTPLNIIIGFAQVLREHFSSDALSEEEETHITTMMKHNTNNLNHMVLMLYDSSETGAADKSSYVRNDEVSCNEEVRSCISYALTHFPDASIQIETSVPDNLHILTNRLYLMRTLRELLYNAAKFSDGQHIKVVISQMQTTVRFTIEDVGPGLSLEAKDLLLKPFTKADHNTEGLGLGLPLCKRHAVSLGGDLLYDSEYTQGCRITLELPK